MLCQCLKDAINVFDFAEQLFIHRFQGNVFQLLEFSFEDTAIFPADLRFAVSVEQKVQNGEDLVNDARLRGHVQRITTHFLD